MQSQTILNTSAFDVKNQQALVLSLFECLKNGRDFVVLADTEPKILCQQLDCLAIPSLFWEYLEKAPGSWKLRIEKRGLEKQSNCCS